jgi:hypothetical protein
MKPAILTVLSVLAAHAAGVPLCLSKLILTDNFTILRAQAIVTKAFADAGVRVEWLSDKQCQNAPAGALYLILEATASSRFKPLTLGYAQPYNAGTAVHIFYNRIREDHPADYAIVLGHAMAHEIAHVLQGVGRHSESGLMKARWTYRDYGDMHLGLLRFAPEDVELLQFGLKHLAGSFAARF